MTNPVVASSTTVWYLSRATGIALSGAPRVFCIGYSLPDGDTVMRTLLRTTTQGRDFVVVDRNPAIADPYRQLLPEANVVRAFHDDDALERFVVEAIPL
jgi:hypothetical protein